MSKIIKSEIILTLLGIIYCRRLHFSKKLWYHIVIKRFYQKKIINKLRKKKGIKPIRIIFFINNISFFKYDDLIRLFINDKNYEPVLIPLPILYHSKEEQKLAEQNIIKYCQSNHLPFLKAYDIEKGTYLPAKDLHADFVTYVQPYDVYYPYFWKIEKFYKTSFFFYYPYGFHVEHKFQPNNKFFYDQLIHSVSWKIFYNTKNGEFFFRKCFLTKGKNYLYVGNLLKNRLLSNTFPSNIWKDTSHKLKRIIWAPHHIQIDLPGFPKSSFLNIYKDMIKLSIIFRDKIEIIFKPHPVLRERLNRLWGIKKTNEYYELWKKFSYTNIVEDNSYIELFASSDALIHDGYTFMMEYLITTKPVLYVNSVNLNNFFSGLALECYNVHYQGSNFKDIIHFINNVVISEDDFMKDKRERLINENFDLSNDFDPAMRIYQEFEKITKN